MTRLRCSRRSVPQPRTSCALKHSPWNVVSEWSCAMPAFGVPRVVYDHRESRFPVLMAGKQCQEPGLATATSLRGFPFGKMMRAGKSLASKSVRSLLRVLKLGSLCGMPTAETPRHPAARTRHVSAESFESDRQVNPLCNHFVDTYPVDLVQAVQLMYQDF